MKLLGHENHHLACSACSSHSLQQRRRLVLRGCFLRHRWGASNDSQKPARWKTCRIFGSATTQTPVTGGKKKHIRNVLRQCPSNEDQLPRAVHSQDSPCKWLQVELIYIQINTNYLFWPVLPCRITHITWKGLKQTRKILVKHELLPPQIIRTSSKPFQKVPAQWNRGQRQELHYSKYWLTNNHY